MVISLTFICVFAVIYGCLIWIYVMIFQILICCFQSLKTKSFLMSEDDNRIDRWQFYLCFCLVGNFSSSVKAIRKASAYLTEEPYFIAEKDAKKYCLIANLSLLYYLEWYTKTSLYGCISLSNWYNWCCVVDNAVGTIYANVWCNIIL